MRFQPEGPNIPNQLLEDRDNGRVVFFCGAGVSMRSGLPGFLQLAWNVLDALHVPANPLHPLRKSFKFMKDGSGPVGTKKGLDEIFDDIHEQYDREDIHSAVARQLTPTATLDVAKEHGIVARLSTGPEGKPQIVTTNFDLLFERSGAIGDNDYFEPPNFPNLDDGQPISGLTYLHGRHRMEGTGSQYFILSGDDFGRAYSYKKSAMRFLRHLFENYTVVLLGYQAEDPPIRYLFKGFKDVAESDSFRLYAFDQGSRETVKAKWKKLGVEVIAYPYGGDDHSHLWNSLGAWADQVDDPDAWLADVVDMARRGPRALQAHERGQVAHVVRSEIGAKAFADATPPAEWLCVFDSEYRLSEEPEKYFGIDTESSTGDHYALDDDTGVEPHNGSGQAVAHNDLIAWNPGDGCPTSEFRLSSRTYRGFERLPSRLLHLVRWIAANSHDPIVAWWAARQYRLHPRLATMISLSLCDASVPHSGKQVWELIFEGIEHRDDNVRYMNWDALKLRIEHEGWTPSTLRAMQKCTQPFIKLHSEIGRTRTKPPRAPWSGISLHDIARFSVEFPDRSREPLNVPDEAVSAAFSQASRNLITGLERMEDVGKSWFSSVTLYQDESDSEPRYLSAEAKYALWVADLMSVAARLDPNRVAAEISLWPSDDRIILNKLRLFAWNLPAIFSGDQVAVNLMAMSRDAFWNIENRREFLILVRDRWRDIPNHQKVRLLGRMLESRDSYPSEELSDYQKFQDIEIVRRIRWLEQQGCDLSKDVLQRIAEIQARLPEWSDRWVSSADKSFEGRSGVIETVSDPSALESVPVSQIVKIALENTGEPFDEFKDYRPFEGLVQEQPVRALSALCCAARNNQFPKELWGTLVDEWSDYAPKRATRLFCERFQRLPHAVIKANVRAVSFWMRDKLPAIADGDEPFALAVFDGLLDRLLDGEADVTRSGIGETSIAGRVIERSRRTIEHAINAPIGHATQCLLSILNTRKLPKGHGMPGEFVALLEKLTTAPGEGSDHAISLIAREHSWLHHIAPEWVMEHMVPWFVHDHPSSQPAWNGLFHGQYIAGPDLFEKIKDPFLDLFPRMYEWKWDDDEYYRVHTWLIMTTIEHQIDPRFTSLDDAREAMRELNENGLSDVIHHLGLAGRKKEGWEKLLFRCLATYGRESRGSRPKEHLWPCCPCWATQAMPSRLSLKQFATFFAQSARIYVSYISFIVPAQNMNNPLRRAFLKRP